MNTNIAHASHRVPMRVPERHKVKGTPLQPPFPKHLQTAIFGKGCFWGVEKRFWELEGVYTTAVGYAGGVLEHPTYSDVCGGDTGHAEVVLVVYDPALVSYEGLLECFWLDHRPVRDDGENSDNGYQYRSVIFTTTEGQAQAAGASRDRYQNSLSSKARITTEIAATPEFYYAEGRHQQYQANRAGR